MHVADGTIGNMRCLVIALLALGGIGCGSNKSASSPPTSGKAAPPPVASEATLYEGVRSGYFQLSGVQSTLEQAVVQIGPVLAKSKADANLSASVGDVKESLDSAGAGIADFTDEPPPQAAFDKDFAAQDEKRIRAIDAANDALHELQDAAGVVADLLSQPKYAQDSALSDIADVIQLAADDLAEAITSLGGKVENGT